MKEAASLEWAGGDLQTITMKADNLYSKHKFNKQTNYGHTVDASKLG